MRRRSFLRQSAQTAAAFGLLRHLGACRPANRTPGGGFAELRDRYFLKSLQLNPVTSTYLGGDGYHPSLAAANGGLRDYSTAGLAAELSFYQGIKKELAGIDPAALETALGIDHRVMQAQLEFLLRQLTETRYYQRAVDTYIQEPFRGVDWQIQGMTAGGQADGRTVLKDSLAAEARQASPEGRSVGGPELGTEGEWQLVVERVSAIPHYLEVAKVNLSAGKAAGNIPDRRMVERDGVAGSNSNAEYFRNTLAANAKDFLGTRPLAAATLTRLSQAGAAAATAWEDFSAFLTRTFDPNDTTDRFAAGEAEYEWLVHNCLRDRRSAKELFDYGADQVALYEGQMFTVAEEVARAAKLNLRFGSEAEKRHGVRAVMDHLSKDSPRDDDELFRWYREAGERAVAYGRERQLFDIPADYRLDVLPTPPVLRSTIDAAYYPAPPFKKTGVGRFYLTPTGNDPAALAQNNRASVADTAVHEGFPGHDWYYKYMTQHGAEISNIRWLTPGAVEDSSSMWQDSLSSEGWALYCEELMADPTPDRPHGFYTPAEHLYELQGQLLRAVRVRVDVGMHTGRMGFDEAMDYFLEHVEVLPGARGRANSDPAAKAATDHALRAIYRYSKWPTQAISYNLGKNAIIGLREQYRQGAGGQFSARKFHEGFMAMGSIPVGFFQDGFLRAGA